MQLREIHIDGFGAFTDLHLKNLAPGVNVLYGPNERGKTTLLEFVRRVLFGFKDKRSRDNPYPALAGGAYGGRLVCVTRDGERVVVARRGGPRGGNVTVIRESGQEEGPAALDAVLGHASEELFRNVYAFTLDELHNMESLHAEEVKNRIYGAGLGLSGAALARLEKTLQEQIKNNLKRGGGTLNDTYARMTRLRGRIRELQQQFPRYEELKALREEQLQRHEELRRLQAEEEAALRALELRLELYPAWLEREEARRGLEALGPETPFPETAHESYQKLKTRLETLARQIAEEMDSLRLKQRQAGALELPAALLEKKASVEWLRQHLAQVADALRDKARLEQELDGVELQIQADLKAFGSGWDERRADLFQLTEGELEELEGFEQGFSQTRQNTNEAEYKLKYHQEETIRARAQKARIPEWLSTVTWMLAGLGAAGTLAGAVLAEPVLLLVSLAVLGVGLFLFYKIRRQPEAFESEDLVEQRLQQALEAAREAQERHHRDWLRWLERRGLSDLSPSTPQMVKKLWAWVTALKQLLRRRGDLKSRIQLMQATISEAAERTRQLSACLPGFSPGPDLVSEMRQVCLAFDQAEQQQQTLRNLTRSIEEQEHKLRHLREQEKVDREALEGIYRSVDASGEEEFLERHANFRERQALTARLRQAERTIQLRVGEGPPFQEFLKSLRGVRPADVSAERERLAERLETRKKALSELDQEIGKVSEQLTRLEGEEDLPAALSEWERERALLNRAARDWTVAALAQALLGQTKRRFETTRQPAVIQAASVYFQEITDGRYRRVLKPVDAEDLKVEDSDGTYKSVTELSRGTREQLYLAMRLGLIEEYESRAEPLPLVMDDVLVNFDDERKPRMLSLLQRFAATRQVLFLTCHRQSLALCQEAGARPVNW